MIGLALSLLLLFAAGLSFLWTPHDPYDIDMALFGVEEARRNLFAQDPQAQFALKQFGEAERLSLLSRQRTTRGMKGEQ